MNDPLEPAVEPSATPPALPAAPRFCRSCGSAWDPAWPYCMACAGQGAPATPTAFPPVEKDRSVPYALSLYFAWLALSFVAIIWVLLDGNLVTIEMVTSAVAAVMVLAWCVPATARRAVSEGLRRLRPLWCLAGIAAAPITFAVASVAVYAFNRAFDLEEFRYTDDLFAAGWGWGMSVLLICVQPALVEEIAFRGVIFSALRHVLESGEAVVVSALMFMIIHLSVPSFPHLLLIGLALGWLRARSGSLIPGMCLHFMHNLFCIMSERWPVI